MCHRTSGLSGREGPQAEKRAHLRSPPALLPSICQGHYTSCARDVALRRGHRRVEKAVTLKVPPSYCNNHARVTFRLLRRHHRRRPVAPPVAGAGPPGTGRFYTPAARERDRGGKTGRGSMPGMRGGPPGAPCASPRPRRPAFLSGAAGRCPDTAPAALPYTIGVSRRFAHARQPPFGLRRTFSHQTATFTLEKCPEGNEAVATRCNRTV